MPHNLRIEFASLRAADLTCARPLMLNVMCLTRIDNE